MFPVVKGSLKLARSVVVMKFDTWSLELYMNWHLSVMLIAFVCLSLQPYVPHYFKPCCLPGSSDCVLITHRHCVILGGKWHIAEVEHCSQAQCHEDFCLVFSSTQHIVSFIILSSVPVSYHHSWDGWRNELLLWNHVFKLDTFCSCFFLGNSTIKFSVVETTIISYLSLRYYPLCVVWVPSTDCWIESGAESWMVPFWSCLSSIHKPAGSSISC